MSILLQTLLGTQSVLLAFFLLSRRGQEMRHHFFLAGFLLTLTLHMGFNILNTYTAFVIDVGSSLGFLYGPWIYLYTRSTALRKDLALKSQWPHGIPSLLVLVSVVSGFSPPQQILAGAATASLEAYLFLALHLTKINSLDNKNIQHEGTQSNLDWLRKVIISLIIIGALDFVHSITLASATNWSPLFYSGVIFALWSLVNYLIYKGLQKSFWFVSDVAIKKSENPNSSVSDKIEQSNVTLNLHLQHMKRIEEAISNSSLVTDPDLTLERFSERISLSSRKISEAINTVCRQSFSDFINHHRINYACQKLKDPSNDHKTILEILFESGFSTKSNFYAAFKKKMGQTPVEFRKSAKIESKIKQKGPLS